MKTNVTTLLLVVLAFLLGFFAKTMMVRADEDTVADETQAEVQENSEESTEPGPMIEGVAGIFFKSQDPQKLMTWYKEVLGLNTNAYGARFQWQENCDTTRFGSLQWSVFPEENEYMNPSPADFMINYQVRDIEELVATLKEKGVEMLDTIAVYPYGSFAHLLDIDSNKIELYQPNFDYKP